MKFEDCIKEKLVRKKPIDIETAKSLRKLADIRLKDIQEITTPTLKAEAYYEIIKELITALLSLRGYKSYSHECLISFIEAEFKFSNYELNLIDQLRIIRNDIAYRGVFVEPDYLERNLKYIRLVIDKLKQEVDKNIR